MMMLTEAEKSSALWLKLKEHFGERLDLMRRKNDGDLDPERTQKVRGRIAEIKDFLSIEDKGLPVDD